MDNESDFTSISHLFCGAHKYKIYIEPYISYTIYMMKFFSIPKSDIDDNPRQSAKETFD